jgi:N-methylhydantoinase A
MAGMVGVDVGGTFTDLMLLVDDRLSVYKRPSTPDDPARAVLAGIEEMMALPETGAVEIIEVVHGSTVATNAVLERKGARTGLVNSAGMRDLLEIGRQNRPKLYALEPRRPEPLVPRERRYETNERLAFDGSVLRPLSEAEIERVVDAATADGVESLAICLLFSYVNSRHEQAIASAARARGLNVSVSSEIVPEYREYERASTTVVNAFVATIVGAYVSGLEGDLKKRGVDRFRMVQSDGGSAGAATVTRLPVSTVLSGPAAGVAGAFAAARLAGLDQVITFDMGGTSTDVAVCPGSVLHRSDLEVEGLPVRTPAVDVHTVGAGGGSIARMDAGGALRVGPESAGADPGPACYGRGDRAAVTDAQLVLGRLQADHFLGGRMTLHADRAIEALERLGGRAEEIAAAVVRVANANMERAIRVISVERGYDPRQFTLVAFGGAGPLHACELAQSLRIPRVLIPPWPGVLSAFGMLTAPVARVYQRAVMREVRDSDSEGAEWIRSVAADLEREGREDLVRDGYNAELLDVEVSLDMRYAGQSFEIGVNISDVASSQIETIVAQFHDLHLRRYGYADRSRAVEAVNLRCRVFVPGQTPALTPPPDLPGGIKRALVQETRQWYAGSWHEAGVYVRDRLCKSDRIEGPAVIVQMDTTVAIPPDWSAAIDEMGNILIEG